MLDYRGTVFVVSQCVVIHCNNPTIRPQDVIIFMIGGTTYEEARTVTLFNQDPVAASNGGVPSAAGTRLLLGGTCVHNSSSYENFRLSYFASLTFLQILGDDPFRSGVLPVLCL